MKKKLVAIMMGCMLALTAMGCGAGKTADTAESTEAVSEEATADTDAENSEVESEDAADTEAGDAADSETEESAENAEAQSDDTKTGDASDTSAVTTDRSGNAITVPENVESIISMAPSTTRILIDLGLADKIVACDTYSYAGYGSELKADIPQFDMMAPDQEQIIALKADIIFTSGMSESQGADVFESVRETGACVADIPSSASLKDIEEDITFIGQCVGEADAAKRIVDDMQAKIDEFAAIGSTIPEEEKKTVLFELYTPSADNPYIYTAGNGTYINEMLEIIGAKNVAATETDQWPALSEEAAVASNPDVILTADMYTPDVINTILGMSGWENVNAVKNSEVYQINSDAVNQPNHHVIDAMIEMATSIYPDKYENVALDDAA
ncbi:ABC transporter substrate-binding protein [Butyrivibrio sp. AC2005]|uniref:ABC transporter substrate-binding protein n=1 Tax=Butyrivibrio sp. AC2005 TaxID=1280672 RepID=UPI0003F74959|nr:ABC transporter substrate-binding protein [Butyrivibrio sp. AC2005]